MKELFSIEDCLEMFDQWLVFCTNNSSDTNYNKVNPLKYKTSKFWFQVNDDYFYPYKVYWNNNNRHIVSFLKNRECFQTFLSNTI